MNELSSEESDSQDNHYTIEEIWREMDNNKSVTSSAGTNEKKPPPDDSTGNKVDVNTNKIEIIDQHILIEASSGEAIQNNVPLEEQIYYNECHGDRSNDPLVIIIDQSLLGVVSDGNAIQIDDVPLDDVAQTSVQDSISVVCTDENDQNLLGVVSVNTMKTDEPQEQYEKLSDVFLTQQNISLDSFSGNAPSFNNSFLDNLTEFEVIVDNENRNIIQDDSLNISEVSQATENFADSSRVWNDKNSEDVDDPDYILEKKSADESGEEGQEVQNCNEGKSTNEDTSEVLQDDPNMTNTPINQCKLRKKNNKENWKKIENQKKRERGEAYLGFRRAGQGKVVQDVQRQAKQMGSRCISHACKKSKLRACPHIAEEEREEVFNKYWKTMSWDQRKIYVVNMVEKVPISRRRTIEESSRRNKTLKYHLVIKGRKMQVCQKTFFNTLGIKKWTVRYWLEGDSKSDKIQSCDTRMVPQSSVTRPSRRGQIKKGSDVEFLKNLFRKLPKLPSHYCRTSSTRLYLEPTFESLTELYEFYKLECHSEGKDALSRFTFDKVFHEENLAIYQPRKDQCDTCQSLEVGSGKVSEIQYREHIAQKNRARKEKEIDTQKAQSKQAHVFSQDMQAVKLVPYVNAGAMYYKTKLNMHNFSMFNHANHDAMNYWWDESQGDLCSSSFTSCIIDNLRQTFEDDVKPVILWSDGCGYQNRNNVLSNALLQLSREKGVTIEQKFLIRGHTFMECDSVHSTIDTALNPKRSTKNKKTGREIYLPSQYVQYTKEARKNPFPYRAVLLEHTFFKDYSRKETMAYNSIRPGRKVNDSMVHDLRALKYNPNGVITYKTNFDDEYSPLPIRPKPTPLITEFPQLHKNRLQIKEEKWKHLQELKAHIPIDCHAFYDAIPYFSKNKKIKNVK